MEAGASTYDLWVTPEPTAVFGLRLLPLVRRGKDTIGNGLVGERPEWFVASGPPSLATECVNGFAPRCSLRDDTAHATFLL